VIDAIGTDWKTNLKTGGQTDRDERLYIDFRGLDYPDVSRDTRNFIDRGDCESATPPTVRGETNDSHTNTTAVKSTAQAHSGSSSYLVTKTVAAGSGANWYLQDNTNTNDFHGFLPGETIEVVKWVYIPSIGGPDPSEVWIRVAYYNGAAWVTSDSETPANTDTWEKLSLRLQIPDSGEAIYISTRIDTTAANGEYIYIDDIEVHRYPTFELAREDNLIDRGNCESTTLPYIPDDFGGTPSSDCSPTRSGDYARSGNYSIKCTKSASGDDFWYWNQGNVAGEWSAAGETIEIDFYAYIPTSGGVTVADLRLFVRERDGTATNQDTIYPIANYATAVNDDWFHVTGISHTMRDDMQTCGILYRCTTTAGTGAGDVWYTDDIRVTRHSVPGTHKLVGGYTEHLVALPDTGTIQVKFKPNFAYDVASNQTLFGWRSGATEYFFGRYVPSLDKFYIGWKDGIAERSLVSAQYDDGTTYRNINQWIVLTVAFDLTTGTTSGSSLWLDKTQDDTAWNAASDVKTTSFPFMQFKAMLGGAIGDVDIAYVRMFPDYVATDADVQNDFKDVLAEEIYWSFDGHATGKTRCHIPANDYVAGISFEKGVANRQSGSHSSNTFSAALKNLNGEFSDDQYAAFDPSNAVYNGLVTQKYLQRRCRVTVEDWYDGDFDTVFTGRLTSAGFSRTTQHNNISYVTISARDNVERFHTARFPYGRHWEDVQFSDTVESNSLIHLLARQARPRVKQYLAGNSWEIDADKNDAWTESGGTYTTQADPLFGARCGQLVASATQNVHQIISFTGTEKLSVGQVFTFYVWVKSAAAAAAVDNKIQISEYLDGAYNGAQTDTRYTISGGEGWVLVSHSHTIVESDTNTLRVLIWAINGQTILFDGAMLINGDRALNLFRESSYVLNQAASSGAVSADYADRTAYDVFGFDCDTVDITHPWKRIEENESPWTHLKMLADSTAVLYIGDDSSGTLRFRAVLADDYSDLVPFYEWDSLGAAPLSTNLTMAQANRIVGRGVKIVKDRFTRFLWSGDASRAFNNDELGYLSETIANGDTWPDTDEYGPFFARYDGAKSKKSKPEVEVEDVEPESAIWGHVTGDLFSSVVSSDGPRNG